MKRLISDGGDGFLTRASLVIGIIALLCLALVLGIQISKAFA